MEQGGFTLVGRARKGRGRAGPSASALARAIALVEAPPAALLADEVRRLVDSVRECAEAVSSSDTWARVGRALDELRVRPERIVCYGLGSPASSHIARWQLGLLLLLQQRYARPGPYSSDHGYPVSSDPGSAVSEDAAASAPTPAAATTARAEPAAAADAGIPIASLVCQDWANDKGQCIKDLSAPFVSPLKLARGAGGAMSATLPSGDGGLVFSVSVFDPILSDADREILSALGLAYTRSELEVDHAVRGVRTLFYMPHCDRQLYEAVLDANWPPTSELERVWVLGNSFGAYAERVVDRNRYTPTPRLEAVQRYTREVEVPDRFHVGGVFNNLSLHAFLHAFNNPLLPDKSGA
ncbi:hypothetical protein T492DRAFT_970878 [Pavlovales sp. CCMP2436]|nr:hypothetical protein T492DRAFT_970878 [Pavlovales sp. CCMP2436]